MHRLAQTITTRILAMKFAEEFILIYPLYVIMFGERGGVNAAGVGAILAAGFALTVAFEVPTGVIADKFPRKFVLVAGVFCKVLALSSWLLMPYFAGYLLGMAFFSLSNALESGALQAYLYGTLGEESKRSFGKFWARVSAMVMVSYSVAYVLAVIIGVRYELLIGLSIGSCLIALLICLSLPTDTIPVSTEAERPRIFRSAISHIFGSKPLLKLLLSAIIVVSLAEMMIEMIPLYYRQAGAPIRLVPILLAVGNLIGAALFWTLHSWEGFLNRYKLWMMVLFTPLFALSFYGGTAGAVVGMLLFTRFLRVLQVQFEANIQHLSNDEARATISSIGSFGAKLLAAAMVALVGLFAIDDQILIPLRTAIITGALVFITVHALIRYRNRTVIAS